VHKAVLTPFIERNEAPETWCAQFWGGDTQIMNCSMRSFDMCLNEIRGTGGNTLCSPNPRYRPNGVEPKPRRKHRT